MSAERLRELALELRLVAASRLGETDARNVRSAADELAAIAAAIEVGGKVLDGYVVCPLADAGGEVRGAPIAPPPIGGKHRRARETVQ